MKESRSLQKLESYLRDSLEEGGSLSRFQEENFWQILHQFRKHPSEVVRAMTIKKLKEYHQNSLAKRALILFLKDPSPTLVVQVLKLAEALSAPGHFDMLLSISEQMKSRWNSAQMVSLYKVMHLSNPEKFANWAREIFKSRSFFRKKDLEQQKTNLMSTLFSVKDPSAFTLLGEFLRDSDILLSGEVREQIVEFRENIRVKRHTTSMKITKGIKEKLLEIQQETSPTLPLPPPSTQEPDSSPKQPLTQQEPPSPLLQKPSISTFSTSPSFRPTQIPDPSPPAEPKGMAVFGSHFSDDSPTGIEKLPSSSLSEEKLADSSALEESPSDSAPSPKRRNREAKKSQLLQIEEKLALHIPREFDDYILENPIGVGGMGVVYKARQKSLDRSVAIKMLPPTYQDEVLDRFLQEAKISAKLNHPNVVQIISHGVVDNHPYFAMEHIDGFGLEEVVERYRDLTFEKAVHIIRQVALGLECAHKNGVIHRDIKATNVMINHHNDVKIMDFGLAKSNSEDVELTRTGVVLGTPRYMAPEQASGKDIDHRVDLYSLGVLFFELVTGRVPFTGSSGMIVLYKHVTTPPPAPRSLRPELPLALEKIILKCLEKDPNQRYKNARELIEDLDQLDLSQDLEEGKVADFDKENLHLSSLFGALPPSSPPMAPMPHTPIPHTKPLPAPSADRRGSSLFLKLYSDDNRKATIPSPPSVKKLLCAMVYQLYYLQKQTTSTFEILENYFVSTIGKENSQNEREELFDYLCEMADKNMVMFLDYLKQEKEDCFSLTQGSLVDVLLQREGLSD